MSQETAVFCDEPGKSILEYDKEGSMSPEAEGSWALPPRPCSRVHTQEACQKKLGKEKMLPLSDL